MKHKHITWASPATQDAALRVINARWVELHPNVPMVLADTSGRITEPSLAARDAAFRKAFRQCGGILPRIPGLETADMRTR